MQYLTAVREGQPVPPELKASDRAKDEHAANGAAGDHKIDGTSAQSVVIDVHP